VKARRPRESAALYASADAVSRHHRARALFAVSLKKSSRRQHLRYRTDVGDHRFVEAGVRVGGTWKYLFRAVDKQGRLIDFMLSDRRNTKAARRFLAKALKVMRTDKLFDLAARSALPSAADSIRPPLMQQSHLFIRFVHGVDRRCSSSLSPPIAASNGKVAWKDG
jgi:transposase-like protein